MLCWGLMDKRNIGFFVHIVGSPTNQLFKDLTDANKNNPDSQSLIYSNSAHACDESLMAKLEAYSLADEMMSAPNRSMKTSTRTR